MHYSFLSVKGGKKCNDRKSVGNQRGDIPRINRRKFNCDAKKLNDTNSTLIGWLNGPELASLWEKWSSELFHLETLKLRNSLQRITDVSYNLPDWFSKMGIELWERSQEISQLSNLEEAKPQGFLSPISDFPPLSSSLSISSSLSNFRLFFSSPSFPFLYEGLNRI